MVEPNVRIDPRACDRRRDPRRRDGDHRAEVDTVLLELHELIHARGTEREQIQQINGFAVEALEVDFSSTYLWDPDREAYHLAGNVGASEHVMREFPHVEFPRGSIPVLDVLEPGQVIEVADRDGQDLFPPVLLASLNVRSLLCVAIDGRDGVVGALTYGYRERRGPFSSRQRGLAAGIARVSSKIIDNARLMESYRRASELKSEFLATLSHELRTPVNVILGMTEMLADEVSEEPAADFLQTIDRQGKTLASMINDLLDLSAIEANRISLAHEPFEPRVMIEEVVSAWQDVSREKGIPLSVSIAESVPDTLVGDERRAGQVLSNLIGNALKFTDEGSVEVLVREAQSDDGFSVLEFSVTDTGIGISPEGQKRLFEAFARVHANSHRHYSGTGLGLAICKRLTALLHGEIGVESAVGKGSTFRFTARLDRTPSRTTPGPGRRRGSTRGDRRPGEGRVANRRLG